MGTLSIPKTYQAGQILKKTDLDSIVSSIETFVNTQQVSYENLQIDSILQGLTSTQANYVTSEGGYGDLTTVVLGSDTTISTTLTSVLSATSVSAGIYLYVASVCGYSRYISVNNPSAGGHVGVLSIQGELQLNSTAIELISVVYESGLWQDQVDKSAIGTSLNFGVVEIPTSGSTVDIKLQTSTDVSCQGATVYQNAYLQLFRLRDI